MSSTASPTRDSDANENKLGCQRKCCVFELQKYVVQIGAPLTVHCEPSRAVARPRSCDIRTHSESSQASRTFTWPTPSLPPSVARLDTLDPRARPTPTRARHHYTSHESAPAAQAHRGRRALATRRPIPPALHIPPPPSAPVNALRPDAHPLLTLHSLTDQSSQTHRSECPRHCPTSRRPARVRCATCAPLLPLSTPANVNAFPLFAPRPLPPSPALRARGDVERCARDDADEAARAVHRAAKEYVGEGALSANAGQALSELGLMTAPPPRPPRTLIHLNGTRRERDDLASRAYSVPPRALPCEAVGSVKFELSGRDAYGREKYAYTVGQAPSPGTAVEQAPSTAAGRQDLRGRQPSHSGSHIRRPDWLPLQFISLRCLSWRGAKQALKRHKYTRALLEKDADPRSSPSQRVEAQAVQQ
ncbi:hypothetical protein DFH09DRAFT_1070082 [Mycena vulgaris]|nr:hypothetical protein DFH09DRAFT_1070082 [Mycena vulgaris]